MILAHMRQDIRLRLHQHGGIAEIRQYLGRLQIHDASEAGDKMRAGQLDPVKSKVTKAGENLGFGWRTR